VNWSFDLRGICKAIFPDDRVTQIIVSRPLRFSAQLVRLTAASFSSWFFERTLSWRSVPSRPLGIAIEITNACNLRCTMCNLVKMKRPGKMMTMEVFLKVVDRCVQAKIESVRLHTYGETLLHPRLPEMIRAASQRGLSVWISTNAQLLDEERGRAILQAGVRSVRYSIEGTTRATYEKIRAGAKWETLLENIARFKKIRDALRPEVTISLNMVVMKDTVEELHRVEDIFGAYVDEIAFSPLEGLGETGEELARDQLLEKHVSSDRLPCRLLWEMMNVSVDGKATVCCADVEATNVVGDVLNEDLLTIWRASRLESFRQLHRRKQFGQAKICSRCSFGSTNTALNRLRYSLLSDRSTPARFQMR
jgi:radical SAM protein with 4Fe4S-binding SPASM domain